MQQLTHTPTQNSSTNVHGNQQNIYDINIHSQELSKGMLIANTLKSKLKNQPPSPPPGHTETARRRPVESEVSKEAELIRTGSWDQRRMRCWKRPPHW